MSEMLCGTYVKCRNNVPRHKRSCLACPIIESLQHENDKLKELTEKTPILSDVMEENRNLHNELRQKNDEIQRLLREPKINNNYNKITIYPFGKEPDVAEEVVRKLLIPPSDSVPKYIEHKYFTRGGGNLKLTNIRSRTMQIMEEDDSGTPKWVHVDKINVLQELAESNLEELKDRYGASEWKMWKKWYDGLGDECYDKMQWRDLVNKIELVLINNRN